ncbi:MAG: hypothetical protein JSU63_14095 [Phycisphaerales bacterium]|nr:MAG: hypothetical protein JSU63_14095 [Phycisphaerales bacterium]
MLYLALTFWLLVIVLTAWGVHRLWSGMVKPKVLNMVLLPGTLVAQIGHVLGLLVTGATVSNTTLYKDDESGDPETTSDPNPRIPVLGPIIIGLLPLLACATAIFFLARGLGQPVMTRISANVVGPALPTTMAGLWQLLRDQITLAEAMVSAITTAGFGSWQTGLFVYLLICLTIRIAPFPGNLRGSLGAILILGISAATITSLFDVADPRVQNGWAVLNVTVATLMMLLITSLLIRGGVGLAHVLREPT